MEQRHKLPAALLLARDHQVPARIRRLRAAGRPLCNHAAASTTPAAACNQPRGDVAPGARAVCCSYETASGSTESVLKLCKLFCESKGSDAAPDVCCELAPGNQCKAALPADLTDGLIKTSGSYAALCTDRAPPPPSAGATTAAADTTTPGDAPDDCFTLTSSAGGKQLAPRFNILARPNAQVGTAQLVST